jgi:hypothetical protein
MSHFIRDILWCCCNRTLWTVYLIVGHTCDLNILSTRMKGLIHLFWNRGMKVNRKTFIAVHTMSPRHPVPRCITEGPNAHNTYTLVMFTLSKHKPRRPIGRTNTTQTQNNRPDSQQKHPYFAIQLTTPLLDQFSMPSPLVILLGACLISWLRITFAAIFIMISTLASMIFCASSGWSPTQYLWEIKWSVPWFNYDESLTWRGLNSNPS